MFKLLNPNMQEVKSPDGFIPLDIFVSSIGKERHTDKVEGMPGEVNYGSSYTSRDVELTMWFKAKDTIDYRLLRDELYAYFDSYDYFYVIETNKPTRALKIVIDENIQDKRINTYYGEITINARTVDNPFWVSLYTTKELNDTGYDALVEKYGLVDGINSDNTKYKFTERNFSIWNAGNVTVEPETMYLKITIYSPESIGDFTIHNITTGEKLIINRNIPARNTITIDGMSISLNFTNIFRDTNKRFLSLIPGENEIEITNGTFREIAFDFRFYYK